MPSSRLDQWHDALAAAARLWRKCPILFASIAFVFLPTYCAFGQQSFRSRAELQRWEERIRDHIQAATDDLAGSVKERNRVAALAERAVDPTFRRIHQEVRDDYDQKIIPAAKARIAKLEAQLANPPPVIDDSERERAEKARTEHANQEMTYQRMEEERKAQQRDRVRQAQDQFQTYKENQNRKFATDLERNGRNLEALGQSLGGLVDAFVNSRKTVAEPDDDPIDSPEPDRSQSDLKRFVVNDPAMVPPPAPERSRVVGRIEGGEFVPTPPPPEPAKPLFDSLSSFVSAVGRETLEGVTRSSAESVLSSENFDPRQATLKELSDSIADSLLPGDRKVVYSVLKGDLKAAQEEAISLLPPDRQLEVRAMQLPLSVVTGEERNKLSEIWEKDVAKPLGMTPEASGSSKVNEEFLRASEALLSRTKPRVEIVTSDNEKTFLDRKPTADRIRQMSPVEARVFCQTQRESWEANRRLDWKTMIPSAASEAEADVVMQKALRALESELEAKERIWKAMESLQAK